ncbi:MAG: hypothetical protein NTZ46_05965 [Verrucomicrobia bacterium]|nr:hypothetical protein [Verrucomicrobiota bacterium]
MKLPLPNDSLGRREFLRGGVRYGLLVGLAAMAARAVSGRRLVNQDCTNQGICRGCPGYTDCELPQALSAKQSPEVADTGGYKEVCRIPGGKTPSRSLAIGPDDRLYLATGNAVLVLSPTGEREQEWTLDAPVRCVTVAPDGTVFAGLRDRILRLDSNGNRLSDWQVPGNRTWLTGLAADANNLFAADAGNRVILRFDRSGQYIGRIGEKDEERAIPGFIVPSPYFSVTIHPDGLLRVNNPGRHRVEAYTLNGDFEGAWGKASGAVDGFCGCCNPIRVAPLPDGRLITCEKGLPRVKIYSAAGEFESVVAGTNAFPENARVGAGERDADTALAGLTAAVDSRGRIAILDHITGAVRILQPKA